MSIRRVYLEECISKVLDNIGDIEAIIRKQVKGVSFIGLCASECRAENDVIHFVVEGPCRSHLSNYDRMFEVQLHLDYRDERALESSILRFLGCTDEMFTGLVSIHYRRDDKKFYFTHVSHPFCVENIAGITSFLEYYYLYTPTIGEPSPS